MTTSGCISRSIRIPPSPPGRCPIRGRTMLHRSTKRSGDSKRSVHTRRGSGLRSTMLSKRVRRRRVAIESAARRILDEREADHSDDYASLLASVVQSSSRPTARRPVPVEVISPSIDPSVADPPSQQLVGTFFNHFGGHFDSRAPPERLLPRLSQHGVLARAPPEQLPSLSQSFAQHWRRSSGPTTRSGGARRRPSGPRLHPGRLALYADHAIAHDLIVRES